MLGPLNASRRRPPAPRRPPSPVDGSVGVRAGTGFRGRSQRDDSAQIATPSSSWACGHDVEADGCHEPLQRPRVERRPLPVEPPIGVGVGASPWRRGSRRRSAARRDGGTSNLWSWVRTHTASRDRASSRTQRGNGRANRRTPRRRRESGPRGERRPGVATSPVAEHLATLTRAAVKSTAPKITMHGGGLTTRRNRHTRAGGPHPAVRSDGCR